MRTNADSKPAADGLLIQVVPRLTPGRCGVSDAAVLLAAELKAQFGVDTAFIVLNSDERCSSVLQQTVYCPPEQLLERCLALTAGRPGSVLVHLSGYGYSADGAPTTLAHALAAVRGNGNFQMGVYFHELFAFGMPWQSAFWYTGRQKRTVRAIAGLGDLLVTNTGLHADWLRRQLPSSMPVTLLPVFSTVGEAIEPQTFAEREPGLVVFGLPGSRQRAYKELSSLGPTLQLLGITEIVDVGLECGAPSAVQDIPVRPMGEQPSDSLARLFSCLRLGFVPHPAEGVAKSSIFASFCAQGMVTLLARPFAGEVDGLHDGMEIVSPRTAAAACRSGLEACSRAAWNWYRGHRLQVHANAYAHWMNRPNS